MKTLRFESTDALMHFLHENMPEQFAVIRHSDTDIELSFIEEQEVQPTTA